MGDLSDESEDGLSISPHDSGKKSVTHFNCDTHGMSTIIRMITAELKSGIVFFCIGRHFLGFLEEFNFLFPPMRAF